jgi:Zn-dependent protease
MGDLLHWPPTWATALLIPALLVAFTVHELAHGLVAFLLGDTSQVERRRLSLNPLHHISWAGLVVFLLFRFGWAKPVWMDASRFRTKNQAFGMFLAVMAGPMANLLLGLLALVGITMTVMIVWMLTGTAPMEVMEYLMVPELGPDAQGVAVALSYYMVTVNLSLAFFNLLPFPPLDGFQAVVSLIAAVRAALQRDKAGQPAVWPTMPRPAATEPGGEPSTGQSEAAMIEDGPSAGEEPEPGDLDARSPAQIHFDIGLEYQREGQWDEAIARYRQATAHDEHFALAYYNLGLAYWAKGRISLAVSAFRAALEAGGDLTVRVQADLRLRELSGLDPDSEVDPSLVPPPLGPGEAAGTQLQGAPPLDREAERRLWISLAFGGAALAALAISAWIFVTIVALMAAV